jgi:predicted CoA-binding protein
LAGQYGARVIQSLDEVLAEVDIVHIFTHRHALSTNF